MQSFVYNSVYNNGHMNRKVSSQAVFEVTISHVCKRLCDAIENILMQSMTLVDQCVAIHVWLTQATINNKICLIYTG